MAYRAEKGGRTVLTEKSFDDYMAKGNLREWSDGKR